MTARSLSGQECSTSAHSSPSGHNAFSSIRCSQRNRQIELQSRNGSRLQCSGSTLSLRHKRRRQCLGLSYGRSVTAQSTVSRNTSNGAPSDSAVAESCTQLENSTAVVCTEFVAETLLPTTSGKFRLRGYRHSLHLVRGPASHITFTCDKACRLFLDREVIGLGGDILLVLPKATLS